MVDIRRHLHFGECIAMASFDFHRHQWLLRLALTPLLVGASLAGAAPTSPSVDARKRFLAKLRALEHEAGGRIGVSARRVAGGPELAYRGGERFLMCSTFKLALAACVLQRVDAGDERLDRQVAVAKADLVTYSPRTEPRAGGSMAVGELCAAAVTVSDNTAANLLLRTLGGPAGFTARLRSAGDAVTRLDRFETKLNVPVPGHDWDSTTPAAMTDLLERLLFGNVLTPTSRAQLRAWTTQASTGVKRLRAALPADWPQGDKTGTGPTHTNDVAWFTPPGGAPWTVAVYYAEGKGDGEAQNAVIAEVGRAVLELVQALS